jgi:hypothetical protein
MYAPLTILNDRSRVDDQQVATENSGKAASLLKELKDWQAILIIVALVAFFFREILLQKSFLWDDFLYQYYPFRNFAAVAMAYGKLPLWNPYTFCGMPFQADIQTAIFYIPNLMLTFFVSGGRLSFFWIELLIILHIMLGGVCMYYLAKNFGMQRVTALFSGLMYALSGFMIVHVIHQTFICQIAWMPLIVLLFQKALAQRSVLHMTLAGVVLGHAILAGSPQFTLYIFFFLLVFFLFEFVYSYRKDGLKPSLRMIPLAMGAFFIALLLAGIQLLPTMELAKLSQRSEMTFEQSSEGSLAWAQLITSVIPKYFGTSDAHGTSFVLPGNYWQFWETCFYVGIIGFAGILFSFSLIRKERYVAFFAVVVIFSLLYALGNNFVLHSFFYSYIPGFDKFRVPGRMSFLFTFSGALLSGFGLEKMIDIVRSSGQHATRVILTIIIAGVVLWIIAASGVLLPLQDPQLYENVYGNSFRESNTALIVVFLFSLTLFLIYKFKLHPAVGMFLLMIIQFADIHTFGFSHNNGTLNPDEYYSQRSRLVDLLKMDGEKELFRINARQEGAKLLDRNQGMIDRVFMMEGYTPLALQRIYPPAKTWEEVCDLMNAKYRTRVDTQKRTMGYATVSTYLPRAFVVYNATILKDEHLVKAYMAGKNFNARRTVVLEEDPVETLEDTLKNEAGFANIYSYDLNVIKANVSTPQNGFLILSEIYYPGWNAYIDDVPERLYRADWSLRAVPIKAGTHHVEIRFEPVSFRHGLYITLTTAGCCSIGIMYMMFKRGKSKAMVRNQV